jgi:hypothetical protein
LGYVPARVIRLDPACDMGVAQRSPSPSLLTVVLMDVIAATYAWPNSPLSPVSADATELEASTLTIIIAAANNIPTFLLNTTSLFVHSAASHRRRTRR